MTEKKSRSLGFEAWLDPRSHYRALGSVTAGAMTDAIVEDNNGTVVRRQASFESKDHFYGWARHSSGIQ